MSIYKSAASTADYLSKSSSASWGALTVACWHKVQFGSATGYNAFISTRAVEVLSTIILYNNSGYLEIDNDSGGYSSLGTVAEGDWIYAMLVQNGSTVAAYVSINNAATITTSLPLGSRTLLELRLLRDNNDNAPGMVCFAREWGAALNQTEFEAEKASTVAVRTADLLSDSPLPNVSTPGSWTVNGTLGSGEDSPYPTTPGIAVSGFIM